MPTEVENDSEVEGTELCYAVQGLANVFTSLEPRGIVGDLLAMSLGKQGTASYYRSPHELLQVLELRRTCWSREEMGDL